MDRIVSSEPIAIAYPDPNDFDTVHRTMLVRLETTDGIGGWGECIAMWPEAFKAVCTVISDGLFPQGWRWLGSLLHYSGNAAR